MNIKKLANILELFHSFKQLSHSKNRISMYFSLSYILFF
ncbi:hypothetical protein LEP1GSC072_4118 [Leptospira noguchii str. Bonito]|nr:hypothetical protein LEP1GSC072_4118 [Leptospira noguchii str. Bonito]